MAKKSQSRKKRKKQRKPNVPTYTVPTEAAEETENAAAQPANGGSPILTAPIASSDATTDSINWAEEYPYFAPDMKRLGIVVLLMVVLLLALNLIFIYVL